jgi:hypothetical protein
MKKILFLTCIILLNLISIEVFPQENISSSLIEINKVDNNKLLKVIDAVSGVIT